MWLLPSIIQALGASILIECGLALPQEMPNDIVKSNEYTIQHCSLLAPQVQKALESLYDVMPPAIAETHYGITSPPYQAFFKGSYYEIAVEDILRSVFIGAPIRLDSSKELLVPTLVCALKPDTVIVHEAGQEHDIYHICKENPTWTLLYYPGTSTIFICSLFFLMPTLPAVGNCPTVNEATNQFEGNISAFFQSQMYMLLHEIAHFYIGATVEDSVDETVDWNYAFSLSPANATYNALNYVLFVASVDKECKDFPQADQSQPFEGRKLRGTLDLLNISFANISDSHVLGTAPGSAAPYHTDAMNVTLAPKNSTLPR